MGYFEKLRRYFQSSSGNFPVTEVYSFQKSGFKTIFQPNKNQHFCIFYKLLL